MSTTPFSLLIRQARILLPTGDFLVGDVGIRDREIVQVAPELNSTAQEILDAEGLTLLPGVIDPKCISQNQV